MPIKLIRKVEAPTEAEKESFEAFVTKSNDLIVTSLTVASSGDDDSKFSDSELTPGPASRKLLAEESYVLGWTVGFGVNGSARLKVRTFYGDGSSQDEIVKVEGKAGDPAAHRVVFIP